MDRQVIEQKLESLRRCVVRIGGKCPEDPGELAREEDLQDIVSVNLTRAVQLCVDIAAHLIASRDVPAPESMDQSFEVLAATGIIDEELALQLKKAVGFRNIAVHNYRSIDWRIVHSMCRHRLGDFRSFARAVVEALADSTGA